MTLLLHSLGHQLHYDLLRRRALRKSKPREGAFGVETVDFETVLILLAFHGVPKRELHTEQVVESVMKLMKRKPMNIEE